MARTAECIGGPLDGKIQEVRAPTLVTPDWLAIRERNRQRMVAGELWADGEDPLPPEHRYRLNGDRYIYEGTPHA